MTAAAETMPLRAVRSKCPKWCTDHIDATADGGVHVCEAFIGQAGPIRVHCWQTAGLDEPIRVELQGAGGVQLVTLTPWDSAALGVLLSAAGQINTDH